jgi:hypothetical protein
MKSIIFFVTLIFCSTPAFAQSHQWKLSLIVQHPDSKVVTSMTSALATELGLSKKVTIVKNQEELQIVVNMVTISDPKVHRYAAAITLLQHTTCGDGQGLPEWIALTQNVAVVESDKMKEFAEVVSAKVDSILKY